MKCFVTGGAGFIGSNLVEKLLDNGHSVVIYDNLSTGNKNNIENCLRNNNCKFVLGDVLNIENLLKEMADVEIVFHFQANADVRNGINNTKVDIDQNILGTWNVLECCKKLNIKKLVFSSSATVYGDPINFPTREEDISFQTSIYGASKLSGESLIQAYSEYFDLQFFIFRFVSLIGKNYSHGVLYDFYHKLLNDPKNLLILGNGSQEKSFLNVSDAINAILLCVQNLDTKKNIFNLGNDYTISINDLAKIVCDEMNLDNTNLIHESNDKRGWKGDSPVVLLNTNKIRQIGWSPMKNIELSIRETIQYLKSEHGKKND